MTDPKKIWEHLQAGVTGRAMPKLAHNKGEATTDQSGAPDQDRRDHQRE